MPKSRTLATIAILAALLLAGACASTTPTDPPENPKESAAARPSFAWDGGFTTFMRDGRMWVFRNGDPELEKFRGGAEPAKHVTRVKAGPAGVTLKGPDTETLDAYMAVAGRSTPAPAPAPTPAAAGAAYAPVALPQAAPVGPPAFATVEKEGRLWVFRAGSEDYRSFLAGKEPAKHVTLVRAGPAGVTLKGVERADVLAWLAAKPGFTTFIEDERVWVFRAGSAEARAFQQEGAPAKHITLVRAGPLAMTVRAPDTDTALEYVTAKAGFVTRLDDGRLWVFREGSKDLAEYLRIGEPAKSVTRVKAGPRGLTLRGPDKETLEEYMAAAAGFETFVVDGRIWAFPAGHEDLEDFRRVGEPAKHVTAVRAGPMQMTVKAPDRETLSIYLRQVIQ